MLEEISTAVSLLSACRDDEALQLLDTVIAKTERDDAALALMLALYAGGLKDWRQADAALAQAAKLEPEYARYNEVAEDVEQFATPFPKCRELAGLVSSIYGSRYRTYRSG
jgi:uncharacterized protein HemY